MTDWLHHGPLHDPCPDCQKYSCECGAVSIAENPNYKEQSQNVILRKCEARLKAFEKATRELIKSDDRRQSCCSIALHESIAKLRALAEDK